jgi:hypothetical protein
MDSVVVASCFERQANVFVFTHRSRLALPEVGRIHARRRRFQRRKIGGIGADGGKGGVPEEGMKRRNASFLRCRTDPPGIVRTGVGRKHRREINFLAAALRDIRNVLRVGRKHGRETDFLAQGAGERSVSRSGLAVCADGMDGGQHFFYRGGAAFSDMGPGHLNGRWFHIDSF